MKQRTGPKPRKVKLASKQRNEGKHLVALSQEHDYVFLPKPKLNMVMRLSTRVIEPHLEYRIVVPRTSALAKLLPPQERTTKRIERELAEREIQGTGGKVARRG